jgi:hypothetical protein
VRETMSTFDGTQLTRRVITESYLIWHLYFAEGHRCGKISAGPFTLTEDYACDSLDIVY